MYHGFKPQKQKKHYILIDDNFIIIVFLGLLKDHVTYVLKCIQIENMVRIHKTFYFSPK